MKRIILVYVFVILSLFNLYSQKLSWLTSIESDSTFRINSIENYMDGSVLIGGIVFSVADLDPSTDDFIIESNSQTGRFNGFFAKYGPCGDFLFGGVLEGINSSRVQDVALDDNENIYLSGSFQGGTVDFDPSAGVYNLINPHPDWDHDGFIAKYSSTGNFLWARTSNGLNNETAHDILVKGASLYVQGSFTSNVDVDYTTVTNLLTTAGNGDSYIAKYDTSALNLDWVRVVGANNGQYINGMDINNNHEVYYSVNCQGITTVDLDPGSGVYNFTPNGDGNFAIVKLNSSGDFEWAKAFTGGNGWNISQTLRLDGNGNIYLGGRFASDSLDFDPDANEYFIYNAQGTNAFFAKFNPSGEFLWVKNIESAFSASVNDIDFDSNQNPFIVGGFQNELVIDQDTISGVGGNDIYSFSFDNLGNLMYKMVIAGSEDESMSVDWRGNGAPRISVLDESNFRIYGHYADTCNFDSEESFISNVSDNGFLACYNLDTLQEEVCELFINTDGEYITQTGYYITQANGLFGCNQTSVLELYVQDLDSSVTVINDVTLQSNMNGVSYQWVDCNNNFAPLIGETNQIFMATANGSYAVVVTDETCSDTSDCFIIDKVGLKFHKSSVSIYPNPVSEHVVISINTELIGSVFMISDYSGRVLFKDTFKGNMEKIDFSNLARGIYFLTSEKDGRNYRIIKK